MRKMRQGSQDHYISIDRSIRSLLSVGLAWTWALWSFEVSTHPMEIIANDSDLR